MHTNKLSKRQQFILNVVHELQKATNRQIFERTASVFDAASRVTLIRDLNLLVEKKLLLRSGRGRSIHYEPAQSFILRLFDLETYFHQETDKRTIQRAKINFDAGFPWNDLFTSSELQHVELLTKDYRNRLKKYPGTGIKKELERITIEFSWRSSHIEGNTYSLLDTERLIKEHQEAEGKTHEEARMILNHKAALEYVWKHSKDFQTLTRSKIEEIHDLLVKGLGITRGLRKHPVGIAGTLYKPFDNVYQIREALEALCRLVNSLKHPILKACLGVVGLSYIQPFEDGNKRASRLLGNALLLAHEYCPLSYRSVDEGAYKKALVLFYEQHAAVPFKKIFLEQYEFAVKNYFC